jgi:DNA-binding Lrp family transcriptional regulator
MTIDAVDETIIAALREDARVPASLLARRLSVARTTLQARIEKLERTGVIERYTAITGAAYEAGMMRAQVAITLTPKQMPAVEAALRRMPEVRSLFSVSGPFDLIAELAARGVAELDRVIDAIGALDGVERTTTSVILSTKIAR